MVRERVVEQCEGGELHRDAEEADEVEAEEACEWAHGERSCEGGCNQFSVVSVEFTVKASGLWEGFFAEELGGVAAGEDDGEGEAEEACEWAHGERFCEGFAISFQLSVWSSQLRLLAYGRGSSRKSWAVWRQARMMARAKRKKRVSGLMGRDSAKGLQSVFSCQCGVHS